MQKESSKETQIKKIGDYINIEFAYSKSVVHDSDNNVYGLSDMWINKKNIQYVYFTPKTKEYPENIMVIFFIKDKYPIIKIYTIVTNNQYELLKNEILQLL